MSCSGAYATAKDFEIYVCMSCSSGDEGKINTYLRLSAGKIHAALASQNACTCTLQAWAVDYLKELNVLAAIAFYDCPCAGVSAEERTAAAAYVTEELRKLTAGEVTVCEGDTGIAYPACTWAEIGITDRNTANIIINRIHRRGI